MGKPAGGQEVRLIPQMGTNSVENSGQKAAGVQTGAKKNVRPAMGVRV
jgi:hypothetical protein